MNIEDRFWSKVSFPRGGIGCWLWSAGLNCGGYGKFRLCYKGRTVLAHRLVYEWQVGQIAAGMTIDHVRANGCTSPACVNPAHLEMVTSAENARRGSCGRNWSSARTHCPKGHEYNKENTYLHLWKTGTRRICRTCNKASAKLAELKRVRVKAVAA